MARVLLLTNSMGASAEVLPALGLVLRGQTAHFEYVCEGATYGIMKTQLETNKPIGFGILMCDTLEQAHDRAGGSVEDKGYDATIATLALI